MKSVTTIRLKIPCKRELLDTMKQYSQSAQYVVDTGWDNGTYSKRELHNLTYYPIREILELPAQLVCSSRDKACETLKALRKVKKPTKPNFKEMLTIRYDARSFGFKFDCVSLVTINGRVKIPIDVPEYYWKYLDWDIRNADLTFNKNGLFLNITFSKDIQLPSNSDGFLGVDVGINQVAVTSNRHDIIFLSANAAHAQTSMLTIAKSRVHFVGMSMRAGSLGMGARTRITMGSTAVATDVGVLLNTGVGNTYDSIKFDNGNDKAESLYGQLESGEYTIYRNCEFYNSDNLDVAGGSRTRF